MKEIIAVYQDCVLCGSKGRKKVQEYAKKDIIIRKVGFTTEEGKDLIHKAVFEHKIGYMPFYTDGEKFAPTIEELLAKKAEPKIVKRVKKTKKAEREIIDGPDAES